MVLQQNELIYLCEACCAKQFLANESCNFISQANQQLCCFIRYTTDCGMIPHKVLFPTEQLISKDPLSPKTEVSHVYFYVMQEVVSYIYPRTHW